MLRTVAAGCNSTGICASSLPPAPPIPPGAKWEVTSGSSYCHIVADEQCVTDGKGEYGDGEECVFRALVKLTATATTFDTEQTHDTLLINGYPYSGTHGPNEIVMQPGDTAQWQTDGSVHSRAGFMLCADGAEGPDDFTPWDFSLPFWTYIMIGFGVIMLISFATNLRRRRNMVNQHADHAREAIMARLRLGNLNAASAGTTNVVVTGVPATPVQPRGDSSSGYEIPIACAYPVRVGAGSSSGTAACANAVQGTAVHAPHVAMATVSSSTAHVPMAHIVQGFAVPSPSRRSQHDVV